MLVQLVARLPKLIITLIDYICRVITMFLILGYSFLFSKDDAKAKPKDANAKPKDANAKPKEKKKK